MNELIFSDYLFVLFLISGIGLIGFEIARFNEETVKYILQIALAVSLGSWVYLEIRPLISEMDWLIVYNLIDPIKATLIFFFMIISVIIIFQSSVVSIFIYPQRGGIVLLLCVIPVWLIVNLTNPFIYTSIALISIISLLIYTKWLKPIERKESKQMWDIYEKTISEFESIKHKRRLK